MDDFARAFQRFLEGEEELGNDAKRVAFGTAYGMGVTAEPLKGVTPKTFCPCGSVEYELSSDGRMFCKDCQSWLSYDG